MDIIPPADECMPPMVFQNDNLVTNDPQLSNRSFEVYCPPNKRSRQLLDLASVISPLIPNVSGSLLEQDKNAEEGIHDISSIVDSNNKAQLSSSNDYHLQTDAEVINRNHGQHGMTLDTTKDHFCDNQNATQLPSTIVPCGI
ncbi:hypothetical protein MHU86_65 [Fragilaria crotonensis]|nr:hypothetical protein MHU86_65 [Fragilaria crotonensis]